MKPDLRKGITMWAVVCREQGLLSVHKTRYDARAMKSACDSVVPVIVRQRKK